jgi:hypothetical protein
MADSVSRLAQAVQASPEQEARLQYSEDITVLLGFNRYMQRHDVMVFRQNPQAKLRSDVLLLEYGDSIEQMLTILQTAGYPCSPNAAWEPMPAFPGPYTQAG